MEPPGKHSCIGTLALDDVEHTGGYLYTTAEDGVTVVAVVYYEVNKQTSAKIATLTHLALVWVYILFFQVVLDGPHSTLVLRDHPFPSGLCLIVEEGTLAVWEFQSRASAFSPFLRGGGMPGDPPAFHGDDLLPWEVSDDFDAPLCFQGYPDEVNSIQEGWVWLQPWHGIAWKTFTPKSNLNSNVNFNLAIFGRSGVRSPCKGRKFGRDSTFRDASLVPQLGRDAAIRGTKPRR